MVTKEKIIYYGQHKVHLYTCTKSLLGVHIDRAKISRLMCLVTKQKYLEMHYEYHIVIKKGEVVKQLTLI